MESLEYKLSENVYFYVCLMFIIKSMLRKQNRCIFLCIWVWNIFSDLHVTCGQITKLRGTAPLGLIFEDSVHFLKKNKATLDKISYGSS